MSASPPKAATVGTCLRAKIQQQANPKVLPPTSQRETCQIMIQAVYVITRLLVGDPSGLLSSFLPLAGLRPC